MRMQDVEANDADRSRCEAQSEVLQENLTKLQSDDRN